MLREYETRPSPVAAVVYAVPLVLAGALWLRVIMRRRSHRLNDC